MQENKENTSNNTPSTTNKFNKNYYKNMSNDVFEEFCNRLLTLHRTGLYIPPSKPRICKDKKRVKKGPREYTPDVKKRSTTFGKGRVGVSCESYGIKNCICCRPRNENPYRILINKSEQNKPQEASEVVEQRIQEIMAQYNKKHAKENCASLGVTNCTCCFENEDQLCILKNMSKQNKSQEYKTKIKYNTHALKLNDQVSGVLKPEPVDDFNKYDRKVQEVMDTATKFDEKVRKLMAKYCTAEEIKSAADTQMDSEIIINDSENESDNFSHIVDGEIYAAPSTSAQNKPKVIAEIILSDSEDTTDANIEMIKTPQNNAKEIPSENYNNSNTDKAINTVPQYITPKQTEDLVDLTSEFNLFKTPLREKGINTKSVSHIIEINNSLTEKSFEETEKISQPSAKPMECPVCLESLQNKEIMSTICGHIFCSPCIQNSIRRNKKCPNCRKKLTLKSIHPIFLF